MNNFNYESLRNTQLKNVSNEICHLSIHPLLCLIPNVDHTSVIQKPVQLLYVHELTITLSLIRNYHL